MNGLTGVFAASVIDGSFEYGWGDREKPETRRLTIDLSGPRLDARALLPQRLSLPSIIQSLAKRGEGSTAGGVPGALVIKLRTGALVTPGRVFRDVTVDLDASGPRVRLSRLIAATEDGARVALDGALTLSGKDAAQRSAGTLHWSISAADGAAVLSLGELLDIPAGLRPVPERQSVMLPLRLAGSVTLGAPGTPDLFVIDGEGHAGASQVRIAATLNGGVTAWAAQPLAASFDVVAPDGGTTARLIGAFGAPSVGDSVGPVQRTTGLLPIRAACVFRRWQRACPRPGLPSRSAMPALAAV